MRKFKHIVTESENGMTLKQVLKQEFNFSSRFLSKIKYQNLVTVNEQNIPLWVNVHTNDLIVVCQPNEQSDFAPEDIPIYPIYEDDDLLVINKQSGVVVHPTKGHPSHTIANGIMNYMLKTNQNFKIRFVNRLDMDTSGLLLIAKNSYSQNELTKQMKSNTVTKIYKAIVKGVIEEDNGTIDLPIGRPDEVDVRRSVMKSEDGGYPSITHYTVLERFINQSLSGISNESATKGYTLLQIKLDTGRTHQIRVHMSHIGYPVLGDILYGCSNPLLIDRQALHAFSLSFIHPVTKKRMSLEAPLPNDIMDAIKKIKK